MAVPEPLLQLPLAAARPWGGLHAGQMNPSINVNYELNTFTILVTLNNMKIIDNMNIQIILIIII